MEKRHPLILEALRVGVLRGGETRLYRAGKVPGLFTARSTPHRAAADMAVRDGLIEVARVETRGKTTLEWVRVTPKGLNYLQEHDSPARAMDDLRDVLRHNGDGMPAWLDELRQRLEQTTRRFLAEVDAVHHKLETLSARVVEALARMEKPGSQAKDDNILPWSGVVLDYLTGRQVVGMRDQASLGEVYDAIREAGMTLSLREFHHGLRRLRDHQRLELLAHTGMGDPAHPEYALVEGTAVYHFARAA